MNALKAEKKMDRLLEKAGRASDCNAIAIRNYFAAMIYTTALYESDAVELLQSFLKTGIVPLSEALERARKTAGRKA